MDKVRLIKDKGIVWLNRDWHGHINSIILDKNIGKNYTGIEALNKNMLSRLEKGKVKRVVCGCN